MSHTSSRLLSLLSLLQTPREWPGSELAARLGVSARTVRRDVDRLRELGYPVEASLGAAGGYRLVAGTAMPPLLLEDDEAVAIAVGLRGAATSAVAGIGEASVRALAKLEQVLPSRLRYRVRSVGFAAAPAPANGPGVDPDVLTALAAAIAKGERTRFRYRADGEESRRLVEPHGVVSAGRRWYVVAYDLDRDDWRTYRVDRISRPEATGVRSLPRILPAADAAAYVAGRPSDWGTPTHRVVVTFEAPGEAVAGRLGDAPGDVVAINTGRCRLESSRDDSLKWLAGRLATLGFDFVVHDPPELREHVRDLASRALRAASVAGAD